MLTETLDKNQSLTVNQISEIADRAVDEAIKVLKEIHPNIDKLKYMKSDQKWILKQRLKMGIWFELIFMGILNNVDHS